MVDSNHPGITCPPACHGPEGHSIEYHQEGEDCVDGAACPDNEHWHNHPDGVHCPGSCPSWGYSRDNGVHRFPIAKGEAAQATWTDEPREGNLGEVIDGRTSVYGEVIPAFTRQAQAISAVLDFEVQPWQVPLIMVAVKLIRTTEAPDYSDNSDDIEGYLDIFRKLIGEDMVHARSVKEYVEERTRRSHL